MSIGFIIAAINFSCVTRGPVVNTQPPPPKQVKPVGNKPGPNYEWHQGHWKWDPKHKKYVWIKGYWTKNKKGKNWVPGRYKKTKKGYRWVPGHWK